MENSLLHTQSGLRKKYNKEFKNMHKKTSTFFPSHWSEEKVQKKISEAFKYAKKHNLTPEVQQNGNLSFHGFTKEGMNIKIITDQKRNFITAYPRWPK
jgi:hypothetical protein